jgi:hypothetical protein
MPGSDFATGDTNAGAQGFSGRVRAAMALAGVKNATQLAKACGVPRQTACRWLQTQEPRLTGAHLLTLSYCLHVRMRWLLTGQGTVLPLPADLEEVLTILADVPLNEQKKWLVSAARMVAVSSGRR